MCKKKTFVSILASVMALITLMGAAPVNVFALGNDAGIKTETPAPYSHIDGERVSLDDERILNVVSVSPIKPVKAGISLFSSESSAAPNVSSIVSVSGDFERDPSITMDGNRVGAGRYMTVIDGIGYESYCCDPLLRGPENAGAVYEMTGEANSKLKNAVKNGFPINTEWSTAELDNEERMWYAYITRVAVAMANNPTRHFAGEGADIDHAKDLADGKIAADSDAYPAIMLNGSKDAKDTGRTINDETAQSKAFAITQNRKTNIYYNPFRFEWAAGTPAGAKLVVDGNVIATAPENPDTIFKDDITSFHIEMPNEAAFDGQTATVNLVGIHNGFADKVWLMQNPNDPDGWQDVVFYIPEVSASAAFSFVRIPYEPDTDPTPDPNSTSVKIQKIDALTRENIPGALIRLRGISSSQVVTEDGQIKEIDNTGINLSQVLTKGAATGGGDVKSTVTDGVWILEGLPYGAYVAEEERAPANYSLLPQHTSYSFWLLPGNVTVKLDQDESTVYTDDVKVSVHEALNAAVSGIQNYDYAAGLAAELQRILDTLLSQLKVDAVFTVEADQSTDSQLITFENYPFGKIEATKYDAITGEPLSGTHFRIQGYFAEGNTNGMPIDRVQATGGDGKTVFEDLPAGQYTVSEAEAPPGYQFDHDDFRSVSLAWGQTASTTFYNKPKTFVEAIKVDGNDSSKLLDGAVFRLTDPTLGETWEGTTVGGKVRLGMGDGSFGNQLVEEKLYILTEIQAPPGYVLDPSPIEVILAADNRLNIVNVRNFKKPTLAITKYNELTNAPLAGASFREWKTEGDTWSETMVTDTNGRITWTGLDPGIYSVQEIDEPYGYFKDASRKEILLNGGDNKFLEFFNRPRPILTVRKRDAVTGEPLEGVKFRVQRLEGETIGEFLTDENGMIELSPRTGYPLDEKIYRVTEITPPINYLPDANNVKDVLLKWHEPTELVFENLLKPTLIFIKRNGLTGRGIDNAAYKVEYESAGGGIAGLGTYKTKCGLIVLPHVLPGWYILTETIPAPGYSLPTNPVQRMYLAPGENSYTYAQTKTDPYADPRTNPNSGTRGTCGDSHPNDAGVVGDPGCCGYLCSVLCAGNCGNPGGGSMSGGDGGAFGNLTITNGNGDPITGGTTGGNNGGTTPDPSKPTLTAGTATRNSDMTATVQFTSSADGRYYYSVVSGGANAPTVGTGGLGSVCAAGSNTITVYVTAGAKDVYIKVKDANGNVSDALKITVPAYAAQAQTPAPEEPPNFDNIIITGGTVVYLNPDFAGITITFGNK
jgi:hypothetical protein